MNKEELSKIPVIGTPEMCPVTGTIDVDSVILHILLDDIETFNYDVSPVIGSYVCPSLKLGMDNAESEEDHPYIAGLTPDESRKPEETPIYVVEVEDTTVPVESMERTGCVIILTGDLQDMENIEEVRHNCLFLNPADYGLFVENMLNR